MQINPLLIFPPGWTPFGPYLALPALKSYLEERGVYTEIEDLNVSFYDYIFTSEYLTDSYNICKEKFELLNKKSVLSDKEAVLYRDYAKVVLNERAIDEIEEAKKIIRSHQYYDKKKAAYSNHILFDALHIASSRYEGLSIRFNKISLKYSVKSTEQVLNSLEDREANPYFEYFEKKVIQSINKKNVNFIGISVTGNSQLIPALTLAKLIKKHCPQVKHINFGGNFITRLATDWNIPHPFFDIFDSLITFEGEEALFQLIKSIENDEDFSRVPNLNYVNGENLIKNLPTTVNVHDFPVPNFDGYPLEKYFMPQLVLPLYSSKSCFARCTFCTIPYATNGKYRILEIDQIYKMMSELSKKHDTIYFSFVDETFAPNTMRKLAKKLIESNASFRWYGETRFTKTFTEEFCKLIYKAGCRKIQFGLESYDQRVLNMMKKDTKVEWIEPAIENCLKAGIAVHMFFMVGFPTEERHEAMKTIEFSRRMLNLSFHKYNNPYSTRGWDTFGLDKFSGVWTNPDEYGIKIKEPDEGNDLTLNLEYETTIGMSPQEAKELVSLYSRNPYSVLKATDYQAFHDLTNKLHSEEENFLRLCRTELAVDMEKNNLLLYVCLEEVNPEIQIKLDKYSNCIQLNYDLSNKNLNYRETLLFYNIKTRRVYQMPGILTPLFNKLIKNNLKVRDISLDDEAKKIFESLLAYEFLTLNENTYSINEINIAEAYLKFNNEVIPVELKDKNEIFLFNYALGTVVKLNNLGFSILKILDGSFNRRNLYDLLQNSGIKIQKEQLESLIDTCVKNGMIYLINESFVQKLGEKLQIN